MNKPAKVEIMSLEMRSQRIAIERSERACINCIWFEQHYRASRGNVVGWEPISTGYCMLHRGSRSVLRKPCRDFERHAQREQKQ